MNTVIAFIFKYKILLLAGVLLFAFFILLVLSFFTASNEKQSFLPSPTTYPSQRAITATFISPLQETEIGKPMTTEKERSIGDLVLNKKPQPDGSTKYEYGSPVAARSNSIITDKQQVVVFERVVTPEYSSEPGFAKISEYMAQFGTPDKTIQGSKFYGWYATTYIYAKLGFSFVGNSNTDEIYEFHKFTPTSVDRYVALFGEDLDSGAKPAGE